MNRQILTCAVLAVLLLAIFLLMFPISGFWSAWNITGICVGCLAYLFASWIDRNTQMNETEEELCNKVYLVLLAPLFFAASGIVTAYCLHLSWWRILLAGCGSALLVTLSFFICVEVVEDNPKRKRDAA